MTASTFSAVTAEQKRQFDELGYCVTGCLFSETEIQEIEDFFEVFKYSGTYDKGLKYEEVDFTQLQLRAMQPHRSSEKALGWLLQPGVAAVLEDLMVNP